MAKARTTLENVQYQASETEQQIIDAGLEAWQAYREQVEGQPQIWFRVGAALKIVQELATAKAGHSSGATFNKHWRAAAEEHGFEEIEPSERSRIIKLMQEQERVQAWWTQLPDKDRLRWRSPTTMWRQFKKYGIEQGWFRPPTPRASSTPASPATSTAAGSAQGPAPGASPAGEAATPPAGTTTPAAPEQQPAATGYVDVDDRVKGLMKEFRADPEYGWEFVDALLTELKDDQGIAPPGNCELKKIREGFQRVLSALNPPKSKKRK